MNLVHIKGTISRRPYTSDPVGNSDRQPPTIDAVAFDAPVIAAIAKMGEGEQIDFHGHLGAKKATDKQKNAIRVDGRDLWVMQLVVDSIEEGF